MNEIRTMLNTNNWFNYHDFYAAVSEIESYDIFVELGVWKGHSISFLADKLRNKNKKIYAVDIFEEWDKNKEVLQEVKHINEIYNTVLKESDTRHLITDVKSISWEAASLFEDGSVDFVFIDADHSYESVVKDIKAWLSKIKKGGIISGHDYFTSPDVRSAVDELLGAVESDKKQNTWYKKI
jgi:predicted O-methyltransferase YrrM